MRQLIHLKRDSKYYRFIFFVLFNSSRSFENETQIITRIFGLDNAIRSR